MFNKVSYLLENLERTIVSRIKEICYKIIFPRNSRYQEVRYYDPEVDQDLCQESEVRNFGDFAIVIQGPLNENSKELCETIGRYFRLYPGINIVISTWTISRRSKFAKNLEVLRGKFPQTFHILTSEPIENSGISNVNSQIHTTRVGLSYCKKIGARLVLKTRTDQSFNNPKFLFKLERAYEKKCKTEGSMPIVVSSKNSFLFRPYSVSDMMQFSDVDTLLKFWGVEFDSRKSLAEIPSVPSSLTEWSKSRLAEVYLVSAYLENLGEVLDYTLRHYHECLVKYFFVVDSDSIGHFWVKYSTRTNSEAKLYFPYSKYEISEFDYSQIAEGKENYHAYEGKINVLWK